MLELNQILRANEINFAILAALPALFFAVVLLLLLRKPFIEGKGAEGRGRLAQAQRRMLMVEVEKAVMTCQMSSDEGRVSDFKISPPHSSKDVKLFCDGYFQ
jgi:nuclear-control-of-ATPase protein 2